jgi:hypothetical protein
MFPKKEVLVLADGRDLKTLHCSKLTASGVVGEVVQPLRSCEDTVSTSVYVFCPTSANT